MARNTWFGPSRTPWSHNRLSHAYLFSGERGTGKTTAARLLAKAVNCLEGIQAETCGSCDHCQAIANGSFLDLIEMDAASHRGIDDIREIRELTQFAPGAGRYRVYIIDEIHQLSPPAKDALLKTLEEPPPQTLFVLATTEPHRVPATIRSRTQHLTFRRIGVLELTSQLRAIAEAEGAQIDEAALHTLARNAGGSARDAVSLLDQALAYSDNDATADAVNAMLGLTGRDAVIQLLGRLIDGDAAAGLQAIGKAIDDGTSPSTLRQQIIDILRDILILKASPDTTALGHLTEDEAFELTQRTAGSSLRDIVRTLEVFAEPDPPSRTGVDATLELELAFARAVLAITEPAEAPPTARPISETRTAVPPTPSPARGGGLAGRSNRSRASAACGGLYAAHPSCGRRTVRSRDRRSQGRLGVGDPSGVARDCSLRGRSRGLGVRGRHRNAGVPQPVPVRSRAAAECAAPGGTSAFAGTWPTDPGSQ